MTGLATRRTFFATLASAALTAAIPFRATAASVPPEAMPGVEFAFSAHVLLEPLREMGATPYGIRRRIPIIGGTFEGPQIKGQVLSGGADWQLERADHYTLIEADYMIQTNDGTQIHVRNRGLTNSRVPGATARYLRTVPEFEVPSGPHEWLNQSVFVGSLQPVSGGAPAVIVHIFRII